MEATLTLHRLGAGKNVRQSLRTTNIMENINRQLKDRLRRIHRWNNSDQCHRWVAMGLIETEKKLKKLKCTDELKDLQESLTKLVPHPQNHRCRRQSFN